MAKKEGRNSALSSLNQQSRDILLFEIGNIPPLTQFTVLISFVQELQISQNTFYRVLVPSTISPRFVHEALYSRERMKKEMSSD